MKTDRKNKEKRMWRENIAGGEKWSRERAELIRGNEGEFSPLQQGTLCFSRSCKPRLYSASQLHRMNGVKTGSNRPTNTHAHTYGARGRPPLTCHWPVRQTERGLELNSAVYQQQQLLVFTTHFFFFFTSLLIRVFCREESSDQTGWQQPCHETR